MFFGKAFLKHFVKFTGTNLRWSTFPVKVQPILWNIHEYSCFWNFSHNNKMSHNFQHTFQDSLQVSRFFLKCVKNVNQFAFMKSKGYVMGTARNIQRVARSFSIKWALRIFSEHLQTVVSGCCKTNKRAVPIGVLRNVCAQPLFYHLKTWLV